MHVDISLGAPLGWCPRCRDSKPPEDFYRDSECKKCHSLRVSAWQKRTGYEKKRPKRSGRKNLWYRRHPEYSLKWKREHPAVVAAQAARRRAAIQKATPKWADEGAIRKIYEEAAKKRWHVDHIVPLRSPLVCGLHCEANLRVVPPEVNLRKGNSHEKAD